MGFLLSDKTADSLKVLIRDYKDNPKPDLTGGGNSATSPRQETSFVWVGGFAFANNGYQVYYGNPALFDVSVFDWMTFDQVYITEANQQDLTPGNYFHAVRYGDYNGTPLFMTWLTGGNLCTPIVTDVACVDGSLSVTTEYLTITQGVATISDSSCSSSSGG